MTERTLELSGGLELAPPVGPALPCEAIGARLTAEAVELRLQLAPAVWARVVDEQLLGAHPSVLPTDGGGLDPALPVVIIALLHPSLATHLLARPEPARALGEGLADPRSALSRTEHWRLGAALQPALLAADAGAEQEPGFATVWEREHRAGYAPLPIAVAVHAALRHHGLEPVPFGDHALRARVVDEAGTWTLVVMMEPGTGLCTVYSAFPRPLADALRTHAADALGRINAQLAIGAVELDESDGQLRVRTGVDLGGPAPGVAALDRTIGHNLALMREAWSTFEALAAG